MYLGCCWPAWGCAERCWGERALAEPRYTGLLASAPTAVGDVRDIVARFDVYRLQLGRLVANVSELYSVTSRLPVFAPTDGTVRVLHVSDLHFNPASYDVISSVVEQFGADVVVDTGDITDFGSVAENRYVWVGQPRLCRTPSFLTAGRWSRSPACD